VTPPRQLRLIKSPSRRLEIPEARVQESILRVMALQKDILLHRCNTGAYKTPGGGRSKTGLQKTTQGLSHRGGKMSTARSRKKSDRGE